ncbi:MAG TPA: CHAT domain-containing protein [Ktedonobacteraceae bacterium]|nr:CHAT domain-containing protein [Ktedonobacteraceae bacterium]
MKNRPDEQPHDNNKKIPSRRTWEIRIPAESLDLSQGTPERHILLEYALSRTSQEDDPDIWAQLQLALGNALMQKRWGDQEAQLSRALACFDAALSVYAREEDLAYWGKTQLSKGVALWYLAGLRTGEAKKEGLRAAIACYDSLISEEYQLVDSANWAMSQYNKAIALRDLATMFSGSEQVELLREALACCETAIRGRDRTKSALDWAAAQHNRGVLLFDLAEFLRASEQPATLEEAIASYDAALGVYHYEETPENWAMAQEGKGAAFYGLAKLAAGVERARLLRGALACYENALTVKSRTDSRAITLSNKGVILHDLSDTLETQERAKTLQAAVACYDDALALCTREINPPYWATLQHNKGIALRDLARILGGKQREETLLAAITCYDQALLERHYESNPSEWASTQSAKGNALQNLALLLTGTERAEKLREAFVCLDATAHVYTRESRPQAWSRMQHNKGIALVELAAVVAYAERAKVLQAAIACYDAALLERSQLDAPVSWAATQNNKGNALLALARLLHGDEQKEKLQQALSCYDAVLSLFSSQSMPNRWALTQNNKSKALIALAQLLEGAARDEALQSAITCCDASLTVFTREQTPLDWALVEANRGDAFHTLIDGLHGSERQKVVQQCIDAYSNALHVYTKEVLPGNHRMIAQLAGSILFREQLWEQAIPFFASALEALDELFTTEVTLHGRQAELGMSRSLNAYLAYALIRSRGEEAAIQAAEVLERGRARVTGEAIARQEAQIAVAERLAPELLEAFRSASSRLLTSTLQESSTSLTPSRFEDAEVPGEGADREENAHVNEQVAKEALLASLVGYEEARAARASYNTIVARIRQILPDFLRQEAIAGAVKRVLQADECLAYVASTALGAIAVVLQGSSEDSAIAEVKAWWDEKLTNVRLGGLLIHSLKENDGKAETGVGGLLTIQPGARYHAEMREALREVMQTLGIAGGVMAHLALFCRASAIRRLIVVPCGPFGLLPLHIALVSTGPDDEEMALFTDIVQVNYAPSAHIWAVCRERKKPSTGNEVLTALVVANPQPQEPEVRPLLQAREEGVVLTGLLSSKEGSHVHAFSDELATFLNVLDVLKKQRRTLTHIHFACHGLVDLADPQSSGLLLAYGARLMIRHLFDSDPLYLEQLLLVVLSACQTALPGLELLDEIVGLPAGWLQAGAKGVVASLWPVSDRMTLALMQKFYELHLFDRLDPAEALWLAQRWLRQLPGWCEDCRAVGARHAASGPEVSEVLQASELSLNESNQRNGLQDDAVVQIEDSGNVGGDGGEKIRERAMEDYLETARHWAAFVYYGA